MKKILYLFLVISQFCAAQAYQYQWAKKAGSTAGDNIGMSLCADKANNVYVTGYMDSTFQYCNDTTVNPTHYNYCFVSKYAPTGQMKWTQKVLGINTNQGMYITADTSANVYVAGQFIDTSHCGANATLTRADSAIIFNTAVHIHDSIFINDSILISGNTYFHYYDTIVVDSTFYTNKTKLRGTNLKEVFIAGYDSTGSFRWVNKLIGVNANISVSGIAADDFGYLYVVGQFFGTAKFDTSTIYSSGNGDFYIAKYSSDSGKLKWVQHGAASAAGVAFSHATNRIYLTGNFMNTATFGSTTLTNQGSLNNDDIFVAAIDTLGVWAWAKAAGSDAEDRSKGIAIDNTGNILITGTLTVGSTATFGGNTVTANPTDIFIAKYSTSGVNTWVKMAGGSDVDDVNSITTDGSGNAYLTGDFMNTATFGTHNMNSVGGYDIFISKYNSSGAIVGSQSAGGASNDIGFGITVDGANGVYITGSFKDTCKFGNLTANKLLAGSATDIFVAKTGLNVGIDEASGKGEYGSLNVYPNPTTGVVTVNYSTSENTNLTLRLMNIDGQNIYSEQKKQGAGVYKHTLDFSQQAKGIYFLEIITDKETLVRKLVIQ